MSNQNSKTNGRSKAHVRKLVEQVRDAIDATYLTGERYPNGGRKTHDSDDARALRDYVRNQAMFDKWDNLIERETKNERRHRRGAPYGFRHPLSCVHAAELICVHNVASGAKMDAMPPATMFTECRETAAESILVGYLARVELLKRPELIEALEALDYAQAVRS